jgi:hypothetical protein
VITDLDIKDSVWTPASEMLDCPFCVERISWVPRGEGGEDQVIFVLPPADGKLQYIYTFATVAVRARHLLQTLCPCAVCFHKVKGYYTLEVIPEPSAYV